MNLRWSISQEFYSYTRADCLFSSCACLDGCCHRDALSKTCWYTFSSVWGVTCCSTVPYPTRTHSATDKQTKHCESHANVLDSFLMCCAGHTYNTADCIYLFQTHPLSLFGLHIQQKRRINSFPIHIPIIWTSHYGLSYWILTDATVMYAIRIQGMRETTSSTGKNRNWISWFWQRKFQSFTIKSTYLTRRSHRAL